MKYLIAFLLLSLLFTSCIPLKKQIYFQGEITEQDTIRKLQEEPYRLQVNDMLDIQIKSSDEKLVELFRQTPAEGASTSRYTEENLYFTTYSVDRHGNIRLPYLGEINVLGYTTKEVLEKIEREHRFVSLYQRVASADAPYAEQSDWLEEVLGPKEEFTLAELLPDHEETEKWEMLDDEERSHHFYLELQKYPSRQRQAYLMSGTEGYSLEDVSKVQERSIADVEDDVQKSRKAMGDYMQKAGMAKKRSKFSGC